MNVRFTFCLLFIYLIWSFSAFSQNSFEEEINNIFTSDFSSKEKIELLMALEKQSSKIADQKELALLYHKLGRLNSKKHPLIAIENFQKALKIRLTPEHKDIRGANQSRFVLSNVYKKLGEKAKREALLIDIISENEPGEITIYAYIYLARMERSNGDTFKALQYLNTSLSKNFPQNSENRLKIKTRMNIILTYSVKYEDLKQAAGNQEDLNVVRNHQQTVEMYKPDSLQAKDEFYNMYNNLAVIYDSFGFDETLQLYEKTLRHYDHEREGDFDAQQKYYMALNNVAIWQAENGKKNLAERYFKEIIRDASSISEIANAYDNLAYFFHSEQSEKGLELYQRAINIILGIEWQGTEEFKIPSFDMIASSDYIDEIMTYLSDMSLHSVNAYKKEKNSSYLLLAENALSREDQLVSLLRYESSSQQSKLFWINRGVDTYLLAVEVAYLLSKPSEAFYYMEKNKGLLLQENIKTFQAKLETSVPFKFLEKEYDLHYELQLLEREFRENFDDPEIRDKYNLINTQYLQFMDSLKSYYPEYVKIKTSVDISTLEEAIARYNEENQCFVEYIVGDDKGFGLYIDKEGVEFFEIPDVTLLKKDISMLKSYISKPVLSLEEISNFKISGFRAFSRLLPFNGAAEKIRGKNLVVSADNYLLNFPFETLVIDSVGDLTDSYLIVNCELSYLQSISAFEQIMQKENNPQKKILGIAPVIFQSDSLIDLAGSGKSMKEILARFSQTELLIEADATKDSFFNQLNQYEILHINSHAGVDTATGEPWIAFTKSKVTLNQLYGKANQAELVILDACKTNSGITALGEGILNLSRGFFYNGSKSVLASLWNVNEKAGGEIIRSFYENLTNGSRKSKALQRAKINYLANHQLTEALPYYWAGFTLTGSNKPIKLESNRNWPILLGAILAGCILLGFLFFRSKKAGI